MERILILGGSGFIGTNLVEYYLARGGYEVLNVDISAPRNPEHRSYWRHGDILDLNSIIGVIKSFQPTRLVHLAARTDLNEKKDPDGYAENTRGVEHLLEALSKCDSLRRVVFASSMLVCKLGYDPASYDDYCPTTLYGESKVLMEKSIRNAGLSAFEWVIIRPTSIWGPWFGEPYRDFFDMVQSRKFFQIKGSRSQKTFGFVGNAVYQIDVLLFSDDPSVNKGTFYIGDQGLTNINEWAEEVGAAMGIKVHSLPLMVFKIAAWAGDMLSWLGIRFPMTSFRLKNMTNDNKVSLLRDTDRLVPTLPFSRKEGIEITVKWMKSNSGV